ncbi:MAG: integrase arm-type DNA-binding domain-containing protein [Desulfuromonadaceae bacterium]|nr:integrase arm-type DNA-binding domain-containing protein [Desulfuromonadaceae bacterium]
MGKLTATTLKNAKPQEKPYKLFDGHGLFIIIKPNGSRWWRFKYRFSGKQKEISMGVYPDTSLAQARKVCQEARERLAQGIDPSQARKDAREEAEALAENSFEAVAREWITAQRGQWTETNTNTVTRRLETNVFPWLGKRPISEITAPELLEVLRRIEERGTLETAHRMRGTCGQLLRYAIATGRAERDIAADLRGALVPVKKQHLAAIIEPKEVANLLRAIDQLEGSLVVRSAMKLAPLFFVRPGELRLAEWSEIDLEAGLWCIPPQKMKMKLPHIVPLCRQAIKILDELYPLTCRSKYVFPSDRSAARPMSNMAMSAALARMGYKGEMTPHGFRAMARTIMDEVLQERVDLIEHQLAHAVRDANGRAYNRTSHLEGRKEMMQRWADYLDTLKAEKVVAFRRRAGA